MGVALIGDVELSAWLDGECDPDRRAEIELWLTRTPEAAARVEAWRRQSELLSTRFARVAEEPLPDAIWADRTTEPRREAVKNIHLIGDRDAPIPAPLRHDARSPGARLVTVALASCAIGAIGALASLPAARHLPALIGGISGDPQAGAPEGEADRRVLAFAERAAEANVSFVRDMATPVEVSSDNPAALGEFLSRRAGLEIAPPTFDTPWPRLLGGRISPGETGPLALLVYEEVGGDRFGLLMGRASGAGADAIKILERRSSAVATWRARGVAFALVGPRDPARLTRFAAALEGKALASAAPER